MFYEAKTKFSSTISSCISLSPGSVIEPVSKSLLFKMALEFNVISLKKDLNNRHYVARIEFQGREGAYEIHTNAHIRYLDFLPENLRLSILDGFDCAFQKNNNNGVKELYFIVKGIDSRAQESEKSLEKAILNFIREECCEK